MIEHANASHPEAERPAAGAKEWLGLALLALPTFLVAIDMTVLHLAVPALSADLTPSTPEMLWIVDIYGFMIAGLLIAMGIIGDQIGRRRLLLIGTAGFAAASLAAAFSPSVWWLVLSRALLGIAAATLMPSTLSLISTMFRKESERGLAIAIWSSMFMAGGAAGPLIGGVLLEYFWWGSVFLVNVPVAVALLALAPLVLPEFRTQDDHRIDWPNIALSMVGMIAATYSIKQVAAYGLAVETIAAGFAGVALLAVFVWRQRRLEQPMLDLTLFRRPDFTAALSVQFFVVFAAGAAYFLGAQYLQLVAGLSPLHAGLAMLPATLVGIVSALAASRLSATVHPRFVIAGSLLLGAAGLALLAFAASAGDFALLMAGLMLSSVGPSATTAVTVNLIVGAAPPDRAGAASGLSETSGELGMALGIAVVGSLSFAAYQRVLAANLPAGLPDNLLAAAREPFATLTASLPDGRDAQSSELLEVASQAFATSLIVAAIAGLGVKVLLSLVSTLFLRRVDDV